MHMYENASSSVFEIFTTLAALLVLKWKINIVEWWFTSTIACDDKKKILTEYHRLEMVSSWDIFVNKQQQTRQDTLTSYKQTNAVISKHYVLVLFYPTRYVNSQFLSAFSRNFWKSHYADNIPIESKLHGRVGSREEEWAQHRNGLNATQKKNLRFDTDNAKWSLILYSEQIKPLSQQQNQHTRRKRAKETFSLKTTNK